MTDTATTNTALGKRVYDILLDNLYIPDISEPGMRDMTNDVITAVRAEVEREMVGRVKDALTLATALDLEPLFFSGYSTAMARVVAVMKGETT